MVDVLGYVLDGLEQWLEVERECGVRTLEVDRSLIAPPGPPAAPIRPAAPSRPPAPAAPSLSRPSSFSSPSSSSSPSSPTSPSSPPGVVYDFAFVHDGPLAPAGVEMMAKIVNAMGRTADTAPVVVAPPLPPARAYVVLGSMALKRYFPGVRGSPGMWVKSADGKDLLVTYSPAFILRFPVVTDAVKKMKREMWTSLKGVMQRFKGGANG